MRNDRDSGALLSFLLGGLAGASLAVLFAPRSGEDLRSSIGDGAREGAARGRELVARGQETAGRLVERGRAAARRKPASAPPASGAGPAGGGTPGV